MRTSAGADCSWNEYEQFLRTALCWACAPCSLMLQENSEVPDLFTKLDSDPSLETGRILIDHAADHRSDMDPERREWPDPLPLQVPVRCHCARCIWVDVPKHIPSV
jgi:hypothetical protein